MQPLGDNPGPYMETESSGKVQKYAGMETERERERLETETKAHTEMEGRQHPREVGR